MATPFKTFTEQGIVYFCFYHSLETGSTLRKSEGFLGKWIYNFA